MEVPRKLLAPTCKTANNSAAKEASPAKTAMRHPPSPQAACRMRKLSLQIHLCLIDTLFKNAKVSHFVASCRTTPTLHHLRRIHSKTAILFLPAPAPPLSLYPPSSTFHPRPPSHLPAPAPGSR